MFIKRKKNRSGTVSVVVAEKKLGRYKELVTIGIAKNQNEIGKLLSNARDWIEQEEERRHPRLDLFEEQREKCAAEYKNANQMLSVYVQHGVSLAGICVPYKLHSI